MATDPSDKKSVELSESQQDGSKASGGPYSILFAPDITVWNEARRLVSDKSIRVEDLSICAAQDPAIVMELIKTANALYFAVGKSPITAVKTAIVRLGYDVVKDLMEKLKDRPRIEDPEVSRWFEIHRSRCKRMAIIARMLAESLTRTLSDDCHTAGLLVGVGEMLAVAHLKEAYTKLADDLSRSAIVFRLAQDYKFDVEKMGVNYLRKQGIPEALLFALDRDARSPNQERAIMKPICQGALEMIDAFDGNKWEKLAPGKNLPPKSAVRSLQIPETQYLKVYERASEYLFSVRLLDEKNRTQGEQASFIAPAQTQDKSSSAPPSAQDGGLESEISALLKGNSEAPPQPQERAKAAPQRRVTPANPSTIPAEVLNSKEDQFSLKSSRVIGRETARVQPTPSKVAPPQITSDRGARVVGQISGMFDQAKSSEELLSQLLEMLVKDGCFEKTALIVVSKDRKKAIVVAARGPNIGNGQTLILNDPLSPLAQCFARVQSWGNKENENSPFGSKSFALSPINADHETPVALYADCGNDGAITFESRRVFRTVVELLNEKLPQVPGGIPIEVNS